MCVSNCRNALYNLQIWDLICTTEYNSYRDHNRNFTSTLCNLYVIPRKILISVKFHRKAARLSLQSQPTFSIFPQWKVQKGTFEGETSTTIDVSNDQRITREPNPNHIRPLLISARKEREKERKRQILWVTNVTISKKEREREKYRNFYGVAAKQIKKRERERERKLKTKRNSFNELENIEGSASIRDVLEEDEKCENSARLEAGWNDRHVAGGNAKKKRTSTANDRSRGILSCFRERRFANARTRACTPSSSSFFYFRSRDTWIDEFSR